MFALEIRKLHGLIAKYELFFILDGLSSTEEHLESLDACVVLTTTGTASVAKNCVHLPSLDFALGVLSTQAIEGKVVLVTA